MSPNRNEENSIVTQPTRPAVNARECNLMTEAGDLREMLRGSDALVEKQALLIGDQREELRKRATVQGIVEAIRRLTPANTTPTDLQVILGALGSLADTMVMHSDTCLIADHIDRAADACEAETKRAETAAADAEWEGA